jgi:hypothetical protein
MRATLRISDLYGIATAKLAGNRRVSDLAQLTTYLDNLEDVECPAMHAGSGRPSHPDNPFSPQSLAHFANKRSNQRSRRQGPSCSDAGRERQRMVGNRLGAFLQLGYQPLVRTER